MHIHSKLFGASRPAEVTGEVADPCKTKCAVALSSGVTPPTLPPVIRPPNAASSSAHSSTRNILCVCLVFTCVSVLAGMIVQYHVTITSSHCVDLDAVYSAFLLTLPDLKRLQQKEWSVYRSCIKRIVDMYAPKNPSIPLIDDTTVPQICANSLQNGCRQLLVLFCAQLLFHIVKHPQFLETLVQGLT